LPVAAAVALGAIVAPPDAAAATAVLSRLGLPRRTMLVLQGESLLNDAVALLIFAIAMNMAVHDKALSAVLPHLAIAAPAALAFGIVAGLLALRISKFLAGTMSARIAEFGMTYTVWIIADRLELSPILAVVAFAMVIARFAPDRQAARDRIHSYSVWAAGVFV